MTASEHLRNEPVSGLVARVNSALGSSKNERRGRAALEEIQRRLECAETERVVTADLMNEPVSGLGERVRAALPVATEFVWLIERGQPEGQKPTVWLDLTDETVGLYGSWTTDPWEAARWGERVGAEKHIQNRSIPHARAVEHGFAQDLPTGAKDALAALAELQRRLERAESERDETSAAVVRDGITHAEYVASWLRSNQKQESDVRWGRYPLGMVGGWIERAETSEALVGELRADLLAIIAEFREGKPRGYEGPDTFEEDDPVVILARAALAKAERDGERGRA